jgi:hypothetical protein
VHDIAVLRDQLKTTEDIIAANKKLLVEDEIAAADKRNESAEQQKMALLGINEYEKYRQDQQNAEINLATDLFKVYDGMFQKFADGLVHGHHERQEVRRHHDERAQEHRARDAQCFRRHGA